MNWRTEVPAGPVADVKEAIENARKLPTAVNARPSDEVDEQHAAAAKVAVELAKVVQQDKDGLVQIRLEGFANTEETRHGGTANGIVVKVVAVPAPASVREEATETVAEGEEPTSTRASAVRHETTGSRRKRSRK